MTTVMRARLALQCLRLALCLIVAGGCSGRSPRDVGNAKNPRSEFVDGPGSTLRPHTTANAPVVTPAPAGKKPTLFAAMDTRALALSSDRIYFGDGEEDALFALPKMPTPTTEAPVRIGRRAPMQGALSVDLRTATVAWIANPGDTVLRASASGGPATTVRDRGIFSHIVASEGDIFVAEVQGDGGILTRLTGTTSARIASFEGTPRGLAVDSTTAYVATSSRVVSAPRARGEMIELARGIGFGSPQVDDTWVYATAVEEAGRGRVIVRIKKTGGNRETFATNVRDAPIVLHGGALYWFAADRPALLSTSLTTGTTAKPTVVTEDPRLEHVEACAIDDSGAYIAVGTGENAQILVVR